MKTKLAGLLLIAIGSCATIPAQSPQSEFWAHLSELCGRAFVGHVVSADPADARFAGQPLIMHVRECARDEIRIPFHVGEDRSRTWVITRMPAALRLKHDHRHEGGAEDGLSQYGGDTLGVGLSSRQEFPADEFSKQLFRANNIPASAENVWAIEVRSGDRFVYELRRPGRHFRVEFDLAVPAPAPPPWGAE
ncbi:MAG: hypothetical protein ABL883_01580 [Terricaulis sp.]